MLALCFPVLVWRYNRLWQRPLYQPGLLKLHEIAQIWPGGAADGICQASSDVSPCSAGSWEAAGFQLLGMLSPWPSALRGLCCLFSLLGCWELLPFYLSAFHGLNRTKQAVLKLS